jgi:hypothetical protein
MQRAKRKKKRKAYDFIPVTMAEMFVNVNDTFVVHL